MRRRIWIGGALTLSVLLGSTLVLTHVMQQLGRTGCKKDRMDIMFLEHACAEYADANGGGFPAALSDLVRPDAGGRTALHAENVPLDPWGRHYRYEPPDREFGFVRIWTFGRDGLPGGEGEEADLGNWTINAQIEAWSDSPASAREE